MRSYPVRLVLLVLRRGFIFHHTLCLLIVVSPLSLCRCAGSFKLFLGAHVQKALCKFSTYFWTSAKNMASLYTYAQSRQRLRSVCKGIYCNFFKRSCETVPMFSVPVQTVKDLPRLLRCLFSSEKVAHEQ